MITIINKVTLEQFLEISKMVETQLSTDRELDIHYTNEGVKIDKDNNIIVRVGK